jgi:hypothetical protein
MHTLQLFDQRVVLAYVIFKSILREFDHKFIKYPSLRWVFLIDYNRTIAYKASDQALQAINGIFSLLLSCSGVCPAAERLNGRL